MTFDEIHGILYLTEHIDADQKRQKGGLMHDQIAEQVGKLTESDVIYPYSQLSLVKNTSPSDSALTTNADGSRNYRDPIVVLAFVIGNDLMRSHFFYVEEKRDFLYTFDMTGVQTTQFHSHNFIEFAYVAEGTLRLIINGETVEFEKGDICLMEQNTKHAEVMSREETKLVYISLSSDLFEKIVDVDNAKSHEEQYLRSVMLQKKENYQFVHFRPTSDAPETAETVLAILNEAYRHRPGSGHIIRGYVIRFLHLLTDEHTFSLTSAEKAHLRHRLYLDICAYAKKHCADISIGALAEKFHYNADYFNRIIKEFSGMTYIEFLQGVRLEEAERLLTETGLSVSAVANEVGYHNLGYFYKLFRSKHGILPSEYRALHKKTDR